jgi:integrase
VNAIIANASKKYATIFTILAEIGAEGHELENVTQNDIDTEQGIIRVRGCKGHASGTYKLKSQPAEMLRIYISKNPQEHPFPNSHAMSQVWVDTRRRAAKKLCKPELDKIPFKNLRNYSGAQLYLNMPVRDPIAVMRHLRHKKLETTMHYIRGIVLDTEEEYTCREATTKEEARKIREQWEQMAKQCRKEMEDDEKWRKEHSEEAKLRDEALAEHDTQLYIEHLEEEVKELKNKFEELENIVRNPKNRAKSVKTLS